MSFTPVNERLAKIRIKAKFHNISLISVHAPTVEKDDAVKDAFYANLDDLGIFGSTVGQFSLHSTTSPNSVRLIDFVAERNMVVCSTRFQHLDIHKAKWLSPD